MATSKNHLPPALLRLSDLMTYLSVGRTAIYALRSDDATFPAPVTVGKRAVAWKKFEVDRWIDKLELAETTPAIPTSDSTQDESGA